MSRASLFREHPWRFDIPLLIAAGSVTLYFGLTTPVVRLTSAFYEDSDYSVIGGLVEFWRTGDYLIGALIFLFSGVFPVVKLAAMLWLWFAPTVREERRRNLRIIEPLGKWSMLDVLVVILFAGAVKLGFLADAMVLPGAYVFGAAILLSMIAAVLMDATVGAGELPANDPSRRAYGLPLVALLGLLLFAGGLFFPLMQVEKWVFWKEEYSILTGFFKLVIDGELVMAIGFLIFVILLPLAHYCMQLSLAVFHLLGRGGGRGVAWLAEMESWVMTDVFALALFVAVIRLSSWTSVEPRSGLYLFAGAVVLSPLVSFWLRCIYRRGRAS